MNEIIPSPTAARQTFLSRNEPAATWDADARPVYDIPQALKSFLGTLGTDSKRTVRYALRKAGDDLGFEHVPIEQIPWTMVDYAVLSELVLRWSDTPGISKASVRIYIYAVRRLLNFCLTHNMISHAQFEPLRMIRPRRGEDRVGRGQYVKERTRRALLNDAANDERRVLGLRDRALLALLFGSGIRRAEAAHVQVKDVDLDEATMVMITKGDNKDFKYLAAWAVAPIEEWLEELKAQGVLEGAVLRRLSKSGRALGPMSPHAVWYALGERCLRAGTPIIKPHDARRTLATDLIEQHGLSKAKIALGHKNIATTAIYDMTDRNAMRKIFSEKSL